MDQHRHARVPRAIRLASVAVTAILLASACGSNGPNRTATASRTPAFTATPAAEGPTDPGGPTPSPTFFTYRVVGGDTLGIIASRFATTYQSLVFWNRDRYRSLDPTDPSYDPNRIELGWQLSVIPGVKVDYDPTTANATSTPTVGPPTPTPGPGGPSTVVLHGDRNLRQVALTFDLSGRLDPAVEIMQWLLDHEIKATIFIGGELAERTDTGRTVLQMVGDNPRLFDLGSNGYSTLDPRTLKEPQMKDELARAETAFATYTKRSARPFYRPPAGGTNDAMRTAAGASGYSRIVLWDVDPQDNLSKNAGGPTAAGMASRIGSNVAGGSIVLLHLGGYETLNALPDIVAAIRARGLVPVTLREMLRT